MLRELDMGAISDGRLYRHSDMVKAGCNDCKGCSDCCRGMGKMCIRDRYEPDVKKSAPGGMAVP